MEGNEFNIDFPFVILNATTLYSEKQATLSAITVFETFSGYWEQTLMTSCSKRLHMRNCDTIIESHRRLDKAMYGKRSVKVHAFFKKQVQNAEILRNIQETLPG